MPNHAVDRAKERYKTHLTGAALRQIAAAIERGEMLLQSNQRSGTQILAVRHEGKMMRLVWDPRNSKIITFLPPKGALHPSHRDKQKEIANVRGN